MTGFRHVRPVDTEAVARLGAHERYSQKLIDAASGGEQAAVNYIRTPPGGGSPRGMHTHAWEQLFYVLDGVMSIEVDGQRHDVGPGNLIVFPAGMPHRNWNETDEDTVHLAINAPMPPPDRHRSSSDQQPGTVNA
ncbi:MAG TPA: cupin domain-containing protein [Actinocrinis sp.]|jgi:quercetin dioxygenase-like cupin family protein